MRISWNQPIQSDGRYLAASIGSRDNGHLYLQSAALDIRLTRLDCFLPMTRFPTETASTSPRTADSKERGGDAPPVGRAPTLNITVQKPGRSQKS